MSQFRGTDAERQARALERIADALEKLVKVIDPPPAVVSAEPWEPNSPSPDRDLWRGRGNGRHG